jgi:hypothetical protein
MSKMIEVRKMIKVLIVVCVLAILSGCNNQNLLDANTDESSSSNVQGSEETNNRKSLLDATTDEVSSSNVQSSEETNNRKLEFLKNFSQKYSDFELLDYVEGSNENSPIKLVAIAQNKEDGSSSTLFIVDDNGEGQVVLAPDDFATYRKEDGLELDKNVILLSLDLKASNTDYEIYDYKLTVTQEEKQGKLNTVYSSEDTIRKE